MCSCCWLFTTYYILCHFSQLQGDGKNKNEHNLRCQINLRGLGKVKTRFTCHAPSFTAGSGKTLYEISLKCFLFFFPTHQFPPPPLLMSLRGLCRFLRCARHLQLSIKKTVQYVNQNQENSTHRPFAVTPVEKCQI